MPLTLTEHIAVQWSRNAFEVRATFSRDTPPLLSSRLNLSIEQELEATKVMDELLLRLACLSSADGMMEDDVKEAVA
jgi:hypothetical protein